MLISSARFLNNAVGNEHVYVYIQAAFAMYAVSTA